MTSAEFDPERILAALAKARVRYVLIGGMAVILHGDVGITTDVDITPAFDHGNLGRLATALRSLDAHIRAEGSPQGLPFDCSAAFLENVGPGGILSLTSCAGDIDVTFTPSGTRGYDDLKRDAMTLEIGDISVAVASLADVIRSKAAANREKDRMALPRLRQLLERLQHNGLDEPFDKE